MKSLIITLLLVSPILLFGQEFYPEWQKLKLQADTTQNLQEAKKLYQQLLQQTTEYGKQKQQAYEKSLQEAETQKELMLVGFILAGLSILVTVFLIIRNVRQKDLLTEKQALIEEQNQTLQAQTEELRQQQEEIAAQRDDIAQKNAALAEKNKLIQESIQVASYIQKMVLGRNDLLKEVFNDFAVWSQPRDIVSGDFYWIGRVNHTIIVALIDCMGHGVPAAFLGLIIHMLFKEVVLIKKQVEPEKILSDLNDALRQVVKLDSEFLLNVTADVALCSIEKTFGNDFSIRFAGARRPLLFTLNKQILRFKGSRTCITSLQAWGEEYENETIELPSKSRIFLFSDGVTDQHNLEGKKFSENRLINALQTSLHLALPKQMEYLQQVFNNYKVNTLQRDDILLLAIEL